MHSVITSKNEQVLQLNLAHPVVNKHTTTKTIYPVNKIAVVFTQHWLSRLQHLLVYTVVQHVTLNMYLAVSTDIQNTFVEHMLSDFTIPPLCTLSNHIMKLKIIIAFYWQL